MKESTRYDPDSKPSLLDLVPTHHGDNFTNPRHTPPLGRRYHAVLNVDFYMAVINEHMSAQPRPNVWEAYIQDIIHSASTVDWSVEPGSSIETAWEVFRDFLRVTKPGSPRN